MANQSAARFEFIGHALAGDGPFRPVVTTDGNGRAINVGTSYLVKYPRESQENSPAVASWRSIRRRCRKPARASSATCPRGQPCANFRTTYMQAWRRI
jgi:hypothetical protein